MNIDDDNNPFADSSIRQATASSFSNQPPIVEYNPFSNAAVPFRPDPPPQQSTVAAVLPQPVYQPVTYQPTPFQPSVYQPPSYASVTTPIAAQQPTERYENDTKQTSTRVDLTAFERQQAEIEEREKRVQERERELKATSNGPHTKNFPPLPQKCRCGPCRPCFYQDISIEIPAQFHRWVRYVYYLWLMYSVTLFLNIIAALSFFVVSTKGGGPGFGLSMVYFILFVPASYACWFRPVYKAFRDDSASNFMIFFLVFFIQFVISILQFLGVANLGCGFGKLGIMDDNKAVGFMMIVLGGIWSLISVATIIVTIRVHRLYRQSGASLEQAQRELQTTFVKNETVRGAAREVATAGINAGINEAIRPDGNQRRPY